MLNLCDAIHHLHTKLKEQRNMAGEEISSIKALQKIGKTRFGTHWTAANGLSNPCLSNIRQLVINKTIHFKVKIGRPLLLGNVY